MNEKISQAFLSLCIALLWIIFDRINLEFFDFLQSQKFLYSIYWLAGFRILAIVLFGYVGFFGIFLGYAISGILLRGFTPLDAICLGFLSSSAALISYKLWQRFSGTTNDFANVSLMQLFYLVALNGLITSILRSSYLLIDRGISINIIVSTFAANISGALTFLFVIKSVGSLYRYKSSNLP
jgi:hypothetical protein